MDHDWVIRLVLFLGILVVMALWETASPRRPRLISRQIRWRANLGIVALNNVVLRVLFPLGAAGVAQFGINNGWGLLNHFKVTPWLAVLVAVIVLDFVIWLQHVMVHAVPVLWRLHRVHHADLDYDVTTGSRFHPIEIVLSMLIKFATIAVLGPPVIAVVIFEILLNSTALFNHSNVHLPAALDRILRWIVVTADMHRVHHSVEEDETNSNFGFNLPWWDHMFGTYRDQPRAGHEGMTIGVRGHANPQAVAHLSGMLLLPFKGDADRYAINRQR